MTYEFLNDFNTVQPVQNDFELMPTGTIAKAVFKIKSGGHGPSGILTQSETSGGVYINSEFTISEGIHIHRKVFHYIGVKSGNADSGKEDQWGMRGRAMIRRLLESAHNVLPTDQSIRACSKRKILSLEDLNGLECVIKIGIKQDTSGGYPPKNKILQIITPDQKEYSNGGDILSW